MTQRTLGVVLAPLLALLGVLMFADIGRAQDADPADSPVVAADETAADSTPGDETDEATDATEAPSEAAVVQGNMDALWTCLAAFLVFFMQAGFALVEAGFTRAKNACNIIMKNLMDLSLGSLLFWFIGFGLMFGSSYQGMIGLDKFFYGMAGAGVDETLTSFDWAFLLFQTVFCATAATIVSGAMAERTKFTGYLAYTVGISVIVYPLFGKWAWGGLTGTSAWLGDMGFLDFAGSTVVHSVGGWAALAGAIVIGPRIGKFSKDGRINAIPGHNVPLAALGVFILWLGWFGFNPGSTTAVNGNPGNFAFIAVTTNLAAAAGAVGAMIASWIMFKKPDTSFTLNGALAGLVSITAGCDALAPQWAIVAGLAGGVLCVISVVMFDKLRVDDPVGAISVHGMCGAWGTLAVGLFHKEGGLLLGFGAKQLIAQLIGIGVGFAWAFSVSMVIFLAIKYTIGLRVSEAEELEGLDITEHGMHAYPPNMIGEGVAMPAAMSGASKSAAGRAARRWPPAVNEASFCFSHDGRAGDVAFGCGLSSSFLIRLRIAGHGDLRRPKPLD